MKVCLPLRFIFRNRRGLRVSREGIALKADRLDCIFQSVRIGVNGANYTNVPLNHLHHEWCFPSLSYYERGDGNMLPLSSSDKSCVRWQENKGFQERAEYFSTKKKTGAHFTGADDSGPYYDCTLKIDLDCGPLSGYFKGVDLQANTALPHMYELDVTLYWNESQGNLDSLDVQKRSATPWTRYLFEVQQPITRLAFERKGIKCDRKSILKEGDFQVFKSPRFSVAAATNTTFTIVNAVKDGLDRDAQTAALLVYFNMFMDIHEANAANGGLDRVYPYLAVFNAAGVLQHHNNVYLHALQNRTAHGVRDNNTITVRNAIQIAAGNVCKIIWPWMMRDISLAIVGSQLYLQYGPELLTVGYEPEYWHQLKVINRERILQALDRRDIPPIIGNGTTGGGSIVQGRQLPTWLGGKNIFDLREFVEDIAAGGMTDLQKIAVYMAIASEDLRQIVIPKMNKGPCRPYFADGLLANDLVILRNQKLFEVKCPSEVQVGQEIALICSEKSQYNDAGGTVRTLDFNGRYVVQDAYQVSRKGGSVLRLKQSDMQQSHLAAHIRGDVGDFQHATLSPIGGGGDVTIVEFNKDVMQDPIVQCEATWQGTERPFIEAECVYSENLKSEYVLDTFRYDFHECRNTSQSLIKLSDIDGNTAFHFPEIRIVEGWTCAYLYAVLDPKALDFELATSGLSSVCLDVTRLKVRFNEKFVWNFQRQGEGDEYLYRTYVRSCPGSQLTFQQWKMYRNCVCFQPQDMTYPPLQESRKQLGTLVVSVTPEKGAIWDRIIENHFVERSSLGLSSAKSALDGTYSQLATAAELKAHLENSPVSIRLVLEYNNKAISISEDGKVRDIEHFLPSIGRSGFEFNDVQPSGAQFTGVQGLRSMGHVMQPWEKFKRRR